TPSEINRVKAADRARYRTPPRGPSPSRSPPRSAAPSTHSTSSTRVRQGPAERFQHQCLPWKALVLERPGRLDLTAQGRRGTDTDTGRGGTRHPSSRKPPRSCVSKRR